MLTSILRNAMAAPLRRPRILNVATAAAAANGGSLFRTSPAGCYSTSNFCSSTSHLPPPSVRSLSALRSEEEECCPPGSSLIPAEESEAEKIFQRAKRSFDDAWALLEHCGIPLVFPREIIFLLGAPGAGKSANSKFIMNIRGFAHDPLVMSELLKSSHPEENKAISEGNLVDDKKAVETLLLELVKPVHRAGALIDGFPRTKDQVSMLPLLCDKMAALHKAGVPGAPAPRFYVCILNVGREESFRRQKQRGLKAKEHNRKMRELGALELLEEERETDFSDELIGKRYEIYLDHKDTVTALSRMFHFHSIDTEQPIAAVQESIRREFAYQSERELDSLTYETVGEVPMAHSLRDYARDALVQRLNENRRNDSSEFKEAVDFVRARVVPACRMAAFAGVAQLRLPPEDPFHDRFSQPKISQMVVDVLSERGYKTCVASSERDIPVRVLSDGSIEMKKRTTHVLNVRFPVAVLRDSFSREDMD